MKKWIALVLLLATVLSCFGCVKSEPEGNQAEEEAILAARRQAVIDQMLEQVTFLWRTDVDITYSKKWSSEGIEKDEKDNVFTFKAGRLYRGLPYTHGSGGAYDFQVFATEVDENGIYHISGMNTQTLTGIDTMEENLRSRVGADCNDAVYWAWSKVSPSVDFMFTYEMTEAHNCVKVGQYECDPVKLSMTKDVCKENGASTMFEAYACLQPGDAVVYNHTPSSHAMMISEVVVAEKEDGTPDYMNSYVKVIHQTSSNLFKEKFYYDETLGENVYYCGGVDDVYEFYQLFNSGYLPVTCKELVDPSPIEEGWVKDSETEYGFENLTTGIISSNFAISYLTLTILDEGNQEVQKATCLVIGDELKAFDMGHFTAEMEKEVMVGAYDPDALASGNYRCLLECRLSNGDLLTVRDFEFTK